MPTAAQSKYAENQFLTATVNRYPLMGEILADTLPRATAAVGGNPAFAAALAQLTAAATAWNQGETAVANAEAALPSHTLAFDDKLTSLTRKPDADSNSLLESWDITVRSEVAYRGPLYRELLPRGRQAFSSGSREERLDALQDFGSRLTAQSAKPVLVALGTTVSAFATAARALRTAQTQAKSTLETARRAQEPLRLAAGHALYGLIGQGMATWNATPDRVDTLWDVNLLRNSQRKTPDAPAATTWDPASRTLSTPTLPPRAARLEAWRATPGTPPELLLTAAPHATAVVLPANVHFLPGSFYQLWLVATNARGRSAPGPVQSWTAE